METKTARLQPQGDGFPHSLAATVGRWASAPLDARMWRVDAGPVPPGQVLACAGEADVQPYTLRLGDEPVAYGELWVDDDESEVELARLIVDPERRGRGLGRALTQSLADLAVTFHPAVFLRVRPDNEVAIGCYQSVGFQRVSAKSEQEWNTDQPIAYAWFELPR
ncbi:GNAT family N-acetyltransferase [Luteipulveratus mongoliensis]|uniref:GNAT family N-acetyltransferase n=1 Tax=Luteipulveratus mongoliensis TaxID=571913 RepID=UPI0014706A2F|nr:GNAT family N-acetyltransferase [Luteipulveratus mongoliensis]